jgi:hypothetical protein
MRAMSEAPAGASEYEEMPNLVYSPSGSATTGFSGGSSLGLQYKGAWCTPPRVFVDYQVLDSCVCHHFSCVSSRTTVLIPAKNPAETSESVPCQFSHMTFLSQFTLNRNFLPLDLILCFSYFLKIYIEFLTNRLRMLHNYFGQGLNFYGSLWKLFVFLAASG